MYNEAPWRYQLPIFLITIQDEGPTSVFSFALTLGPLVFVLLWALCGPLQVLYVLVSILAYLLIPPVCAFLLYLPWCLSFWISHFTASCFYFFLKFSINVSPHIPFLSHTPPRYITEFNYILHCVLYFFIGTYIHAFILNIGKTSLLKIFLIWGEKYSKYYYGEYSKFTINIFELHVLLM